LQLTSNGSTAVESSGQETDCLLASLQRLVTVAVAAVLDIDVSSALISRLVRQWEILQYSPPTPSLRLEGVQFVTVLISFPADVISLDRIGQFLLAVLKERHSLNIEVVRATVSAVRGLAIKDAECVCSSKIDVELLKVSV
jgi:hypothetical protein